MKRNLLLSLGGILGSFLAVCSIFGGIQRLDLLIISLLCIFISSCLSLALDGRRSYIAMQICARVLFSGALASALIAALSQTAIKLSTVLSLHIVTAGFLSSLLFMTYLAMLFGLLYAGRERITS
ncbi:MAG: hypothetical protein KDD60_01690 [Bdellovibrionales bacterium]|nr:hypothetical protein [Bdellovibrionales bacterium]